MLLGSSYAEGSRRSKRRPILAWAAAAAGLVIATGSAGWLFLNRGTSGEPIATEVRTQLDLRPYALMRGERRRAITSSHSATGPRGANPALPTGSEPGSYEVEIRDASATVKASALGDADLRNQVTAARRRSLRSLSAVRTRSQFAVSGKTGDYSQCRLTDRGLGTRAHPTELTDSPQGDMSERFESTLGK